MEYVFNSMIIATDISAYLPSAELSGVKSLCGLCVQKLANFSTKTYVITLLMLLAFFDRSARGELLLFDSDLKTPGRPQDPETDSRIFRRRNDRPESVVGRRLRRLPRLAGYLFYSLHH